MVIRHIAAHKGRTVKKYMPRAYGRATPWFKEHVHIEVILEEVEEE
jgi:large subunit ribosomal protein L22